MLSMSDYVDALWDFGMRESDIAQVMQISKRQVLKYRAGKTIEAPTQKPATETRTATTLGWAGSGTCHRIKITLPYSGTI